MTTSTTMSQGQQARQGVKGNKHDNESRATSTTRSQGQQARQGVKDKHDMESRTTSTTRTTLSQGQQARQGVKDNKHDKESRTTSTTRITRMTTRSIMTITMMYLGVLIMCCMQTEQRRCWNAHFEEMFMLRFVTVWARSISTLDMSKHILD